MADEEVEIHRGHNARQLLENNLLNEALEKIEMHFTSKMVDSELSQSAVREEAYRMLCAVRMFNRHLTNIIETGKMATVAQAQREELSERERKLAEWDGSPDSGYAGT
jgi:signal transduction protein with GAF and PtsI domain